MAPRTTLTMMNMTPVGYRCLPPWPPRRLGFLLEPIDLSKSLIDHCLGQQNAVVNRPLYATFQALLILFPLLVGNWTLELDGASITRNVVMACVLIPCACLSLHNTPKIAFASCRREEYFRGRNRILCRCPITTNSLVIKIWRAS
jgi:hypothetical protein